MATEIYVSTDIRWFDDLPHTHVAPDPTREVVVGTQGASRSQSD